MTEPAPLLLDHATLEDVRGRIQHVFVLMLENHSFDHLFANSGIKGIRAATAANTNTYNGTTYAFGASAPDQMNTDPGHEFQDVVEQLCGPGIVHTGGTYPSINNSGFAANYATSHTEGLPPGASDIGNIMRGIDTQRQAPTLHKLACEFVLCDNWHSSLPGPTWPNRFFVHGASSAGLDHSPTQAELAEWETISGFTYPKGSIFDALGKGNWRLYQDETGPSLGRVPQVASLKGVEFFDVDNLGDFADDLKGSYPYCYTFIEPSYGDMISGTYAGGSSQHPMDRLTGGDQLIAKVYNAIRQSPLWNSSLLIVMYDEHGGFYDSIAPGEAPTPNDGAGAKLNQYGFDFKTYGVRVPAIVISPWVVRGQVDSTLYDHGSIPATLERLFNLAPLTNRDRLANDVLPLITATSRTDCPEDL